MKAHYQVSLCLAATLHLLWGLALLTEPSDPAASPVFVVALFLSAALFLIAVWNPVKAMINASVAVLGFLALVTIYQIFVSKGMPQNPTNVFSLILEIVVAVILVLSIIQSGTLTATEASIAARRRRKMARVAPARRRQKAARKAPVKKKKVKKKTRARRK